MSDSSNVDLTTMLDPNADPSDLVLVTISNPHYLGLQTQENMGLAQLFDFKNNKTMSKYQNASSQAFRAWNIYCASL
jgi:hypothetical protein